MSEEVLEEVNENEEVLESSDEQASPPAETEEEVAEYTPNYSYKVKDEEFEFDEFLQGSVTSAEQEEALRELYTKSRGLEGYKDKLTSKEQEYNELMQEAGSYADGFKTLKKHVDHANSTGDFREVGKALGLSDEKLVEYAVKLAEEAALPDEQKDLINHNRELQDKLSSVESRMSGYEAQQLKSDQQAKADYVRKTIENTPQGVEVWQAMADVNRDMVREFYYLGDEMMDAGLNPQIKDIVEKLVTNNQHLLELKSFREQKQQPLVQEDIGQKPILPTVKGNNSAAVKKEISSIDDIKKAYQVLAGT